MRKLTLAFLVIAIAGNTVFCQQLPETSDNSTTITPLENNTFEIKEITRDSLLLYKGILSSVNPDIRHGRFYFYNSAGGVAVTGIYNQDVPYGTWVYYDDNGETLKQIDYKAVWEYLNTDALDYSIDSTVIHGLKRREKSSMNPDGTFYKTRIMPTFNGGDPTITFQDYIDQNLIYPIYASRKSIEGGLNIQFIIDTLGRIRNPIIEDLEIPEFNIEAMRILSEAPPWEPGIQGGYPVNVVYKWYFDFNNWRADALVPHLPVKINSSVNPGGEQLGYYIVEDMPLFNGGDPAMEFRKYIAINLNYPESAAERKITGKVIVQFLVDTEGNVKDAVIVQSVDPALDLEALRVINTSPKWTPGKQGGQAVQVLFTYPINFIID